MNLSRRTPRRFDVIAASAVLTLFASLLAGAIPATATAPPEVFPAGAWVDEFDTATLGSAWTIRNEDPTGWSLAATPGALTIDSQRGDTYQSDNSARNIFMVDVPAGDFTAVTSFTAPVTKDFQGAGLIAWQDMDNYVRAGLAHVSFAAGGPTVIENGLEKAAVYGSTFTARPSSTSETLKLERTGDVIVTSYREGGAWVEAARVTTPFPTTQVGLYALAAQDGTSHRATFDYFALKAAQGKDVELKGAFTLHGPGDLRYLGPVKNVLTLGSKRPAATFALTATPRNGVVRLAEADTDRAVEIDPAGRIVLVAPGAMGGDFRLVDAGGGKRFMMVVGAVAGREYVGAPGGAGTALVTGPRGGAVALTSEAVSTSGTTIKIAANGPTIDMSKDLYGVFYEDINRAADGGLYAELVQNRSFEYSTADNRSYTGLTSWAKAERGGAKGTIAVVNDAARLNENNRNYLQIDLGAGLVGPGAGVGVANQGYNTGVFVEKGKTYRFSTFVRRTASLDRPLQVRVEDAAGAQVFGQTSVIARSDAWTRVESVFTAAGTTTAGRLVVLADGAGTVRLDMISLFPTETFKGRENGMRLDLAKKIEQMNPAFVRFPGGCVTNVGTFDAYGAPNFDRKRTYRWKETVGPVEQRPTNYNFWGYNQSYGIGYFEYFQFAEDLGATALPVLSVGVNGCGGPPPLTDQTKLQGWINDTLDLIEFANGGPDTEWGARRAALGHPKPFGLKYIGLGNEEVQREFLVNYPQFSAAIRSAYPEIKIISNSGQASGGSWFNELWGFARTQQADLVDEHYYNSPEWFLTNTHRYDSYDRKGPKVFIGEYASRGNTYYNALSEAAFMTGIERNSDVIGLASYAPLLANQDYVQWDPDAIWFDNSRSYGSANYYVQKLFAQNKGDVVVPSELSGVGANPVPDISGGIALSTWRTQSAYDNVSVTSAKDGAVLLADDFSGGAGQWTPTSGSWSVAGGEYTQRDGAVEDARSTGPAASWSNYTFEVDARKISGAEGFLVSFGVKATNTYYRWNLGGWNNTRSAIQMADNGGAVEVAGSNTTIETGRTYKVKIEVAGRTVRAYLDGQLVTTYTDTTTREYLHQVVTRDKKTGDTVLKVVNSSAGTIRSAIVVDGRTVAPSGTVTDMTAVALTDKNSMAQPTKIVPVGRKISGLSSSFSYDFPAYSITFLRMKTAEVHDADSAPVAPSSLGSR